MRVHGLVLLLLSAGATACYDQGDGIDPPLGDLYFPTGLALSAGETRLYAISSDFDLQYNGGALHALDLTRVRALVPRECASDADCDATQHCDLVPTKENRNKASRWCVANDGDSAGKPCGPFGEKSFASRSQMPGRCGFVDLTSPQDGGPPILAASVGIGAFATDIIYRQRPDGPGGRLFIPVRGDATLHYIDVPDETEEPVPFELSCGQGGNDGRCDDAHRKGDDPDEENTRGLRLPPEPFGIAATEDARATLVTHQTEGVVALFESDAEAWGNGTTNFGVGPKLQFLLPTSAQRPVGLVSLPVPKIVSESPIPIAYSPGFLMTYRDAAQVDLVRYQIDPSNRPYLQLAGTAAITANSVGFDNRGLAVDDTARSDCEAGCDSAPDVLTCLYECAGKQMDVYIANRTPNSLLVGKTRPKQNPVASDDLPSVKNSIPAQFGASRVVVGKVVGLDGQLVTRVFLVSFDSHTLSIFDPATQEFEDFVNTGRGPHGVAIDSGIDGAGNPYAYAYVAHFTDSYIGVIDLDQRHYTWASIVMTLGQPHSPRASK
jgi:hypothetical protein